MRIHQQLRNLGSRLKSLREHRGLTIDAISRRAKLSKSSVSETESGKSDPRYTTLKAWARALGVSLSRVINKL